MKKEIIERAAPKGNANACKKGKYSTGDSNYCQGVADMEKDIEDFILSQEEYKKTIPKEELKAELVEILEGEGEDHISMWEEWVASEDEDMNTEQLYFKLYEAMQDDKGYYYGGKSPYASLESYLEDPGDLYEMAELVGWEDLYDEEPWGHLIKGLEKGIETFKKNPKWKKMEEIYYKYDTYDDIPSD